MEGHAHGQGGGAPQGHDVSSAKLIGTLSVGGAIAGLLIVLAFQSTLPRIQANQAAAMQASVTQVLVGAASYQTLFLYDGKLVREVPASVDTIPLEKVYAALDGAGKTLGYAIGAEEVGFADVIKVMFGYNAQRNEVLGMLVVDNKETPGLGDKIVKDQHFVDAFKSRTYPVRGVKQGVGTGKPDEVDMITGATISSKAVIRIINNKLERVKPMLEQYEKAGQS